ncbi:cathepsin W isoform X2 [Engystomops pustulosus]|uniref:cathepsin W isoform X2 n=1 Tax=Engystomops pustulosus TaxID=76066 RepID=UPI003AFAA29F
MFLLLGFSTLSVMFLISGSTNFQMVVTYIGTLLIPYCIITAFMLLTKHRNNQNDPFTAAHRFISTYCSLQVQFAKFMKQFEKNYKSFQEYEHRLSVFSSNLKEAERLQRDELGTAQYGVTKFSDLSAEEFSNSNLDSNFVEKLLQIKQQSVPTTIKSPLNKDWRKHGVISKVKNQGKCNSCWAFASVGNIEAHWGILGFPRNLSVQQVLDCGPCDAGCKGGFTWDAFMTVEMQEMISYVGNNGTLTVIINNKLLQHYQKGIIHNLQQSCDPDLVNHAVLIVGYVREKKIPYWIVKNSYGTNWGENEEFERYIKQFNKIYKNPKEYQYRLSVFSENVKVARRMQEAELGTAEYGVTEFSDLTDSEFTRSSLPSVGAFPPKNVKELKVEAEPIPKSCDWRKAGVISSVKYQGKCGSCWAFASIGNIEAQWGILGHNVNLSVQRVLDCGPCERGCRGGFFWDAYTTVMELQGLPSENDYPYEGITLDCKVFQSKNLKGINDFVMLPRNEYAMASYVKNNGTIAVTINSTSLKHYKNGVIRNPSCDQNYVDHGVLLVGYSEDKNGHYWIAKNSWGKKWGEKGFFRIFFGENMCGITKWPLSAIVTQPSRRRIPCPV